MSAAKRTSLLGSWYLPTWLEWLPNLEHEPSVEPALRKAAA